MIHPHGVEGIFPAGVASFVVVPVGAVACALVSVAMVVSVVSIALDSVVAVSVAVG